MTTRRHEKREREWEGERVREKEREREREREQKTNPWPMASLFIYFFLPLGLPTKLGKPGLPEVLILVLGLSFVLFSWNSPFLVF